MAPDEEDDEDEEELLALVDVAPQAASVAMAVQPAAVATASLVTRRKVDLLIDAHLRVRRGLAERLTRVEHGCVTALAAITDVIGSTLFGHPGRLRNGHFG
jgi:hypothetical protein